MTTLTLRLQIIAGIANCNQSVGMKHQLNEYANEVRRYGVAGDIAGNLILAIQTSKANKIQKGIINSGLRNFVGIDEYSVTQENAYLAQGYNLIKRNGSVFYVEGNTNINADLTSPMSRLDTRIKVMLLSKSISRYMKKFIISRNLTDSDIRKSLDEFISGTTRSVSFADYRYKIDYDRQQRRIDVYLYAEETILVKKLIFYITKLETNK